MKCVNIRTKIQWDGRGGAQEGTAVAGRTKHGRRKRRDGGSVGKQKSLKRRVYHELSKSLWALDVGAIHGSGLAQIFKLQELHGLPDGILKGGFTGGRCRRCRSQRGLMLCGNSGRIRLSWSRRLVISRILKFGRGWLGDRCVSCVL